MTDEEKQRHRELKRHTAQELADIQLDRYTYALQDTDPRLLQYVRDVIGCPDAHNLYEVLAVRRFFRLLDRHAWDKSRVRRFFRFYEALKFSGAGKRTRYKLTPVQAFQFASIFGFSREDGLRLTRTAYIFVPRKFSKTTSAAALAVYDMLFGDANAQAFIGANSYDQAKICFDEIRAIMQDIDPAGRHFRINREKIFYRDGRRGSFIQCLTANAKTKDGLNASLLIMDEYSQARDTKGKNGADLKNTVTSSMGVRREPLTVVITTASEVVEGPFARELEGVKAVLRGEVGNDTLFAHLFQPDVDDAEDDPRTWAKVQPHLGVTVQPDYYANAWAEAQISEANRMTFRTKLLNIFCVNEERCWIAERVVRSLLGAFDIDHVAGRPECAVAFDLSVHDDFSAVTYTLYDTTGKRFNAHTDYYFPEGALSSHPNRELYMAWHAAGHLQFCTGNRIDVKQIAGDIMRRAKQLKIIRIGYDPYKSQELVNILASVGGRNALQPFSQTNGNFNLSVEALEMLAYATPPLITLNNNPINAYCFMNAVIDEDRLENKKPMKQSRYRKIDGVITLLMTIGLLYKYER